MNMKRNGDNVEITITDNGWGIPEEDLPILPNDFTGASTETRSREPVSALPSAMRL